MIDTIYIEKAAIAHPRSDAILARYPHARVIECDDYRAIFNRRRQNFRAQKSRPALVLAIKEPPYVYPVPGEQHLGAAHNYYFSHLLNCPFDCRYCFLQGMFASANYVLFVNYEAFFDELATTCATHVAPVHVFSGYDCDSLALEPLTGFAAFFLERITQIENATIELRTKSTQIRSLLNLEPHSQAIVAMSLSPQAIVTAFEHGTPKLSDRVQALAKLAEHGWPIGLRIDPIVASPNMLDDYEAFFESVFAVLKPQTLHSVTLGALRLPRGFAKRMFKLYPDEPLFATPYRNVGDILVHEHSESRRGSIESLLRRYVPEDRVYLQHELINDAAGET